MRRALALALSFAATPLWAAPAQDDLAYSLGARLGERLRSEVPELPLPVLIEGLRQAYTGQPLRLDEARIDQLLEEHEARMEQNPQHHAQARQDEERFLAEERRKPGVRALENGVLITELRAGDGAKPSARSRVQVRYSGHLADGSLFDESLTPQWFKLDSLIAGWRSALLQMPTGAHWRLVVPSAQAYGEEGAGDLIPPFSPLVFDLELVDVSN